MQSRKLSHKGNVEALQGGKISKLLYLTQFKDAFWGLAHLMLVYHPSLEVVCKGMFLCKVLVNQSVLFFILYPLLPWRLDVRISYLFPLWQPDEQRNQWMTHVPVCPSVHPPCTARVRRPLHEAVSWSPHDSSWWHHTADTCGPEATHSCYQNTGRSTVSHQVLSITFQPLTS